jgi:hypothetical protein
MLIHLFVLVGLVIPITDTIWWRTAGGTVVEHRDGDYRDCSLVLADDLHSVTFDWLIGSVAVTATSRTWHLPEGKQPVAVQIGDQWLDKAKSVVLEADGHDTTIRSMIDQPIEDLLRNASQIRVKTAVGDLVLPVNPRKMEALLTAAGRCRSLTKR